MLHRIVIISDNITEYRNMENTAVGGGLYFSYLANPAAREMLGEAYRFFSENRIADFSLSIVAAGPLPGTFLLDIAAFFFLPGYYRINDKMMLNILSDTLEGFDRSREISTALLAQGINNAEINCIWSLPGNAQQAAAHEYPAYTIFNSSSHLSEHYVHSLSLHIVPNQLFFLQPAGLTCTELNAFFQETEKALRSRNYPAYAAALTIQSLESDKAALGKKHFAAAAELENYKTHLETMRSSHEAKALQAFYDNEYEILPLWFKRLGHIVKVLMGKRNGRSLFTDQVKKYKD